MLSFKSILPICLILAIVFIFQVNGTNQLVKRNKKHAKTNDGDGDVPHNNGGPFILPFQTELCGSTPPGYTCFKECDQDPACQVLGWNVSQIGCACPAIYCKDGNIYGPPDYNNLNLNKTLTDAELANQLHVIAPCNGCVQAIIAPYHKQIGNCGKH